MLELYGRARKKGIFLPLGNVEGDLISWSILLPQDAFILAAQQPCSSQVQAAPPQPLLPRDHVDSEPFMWCKRAGADS